MGRYFGIAAVDLAVRRKYGDMVRLKNGKISSYPMEKIYGRLNLVDVTTQYDTDRYNGRRTILHHAKE
jgi:6-phosphofructokinase 1